MKTLCAFFNFLGYLFLITSLALVLFAAVYALVLQLGYVSFLPGFPSEPVPANCPVCPCDEQCPDCKKCVDCHEDCCPCHGVCPGK